MYRTFGHAPNVFLDYEIAHVIVRLDLIAHKHRTQKVLMAAITRYAQSGDVSVAYQVIGDGPIDLVYAPGFISHLDHEWDEPRWARFLNELGSFARLIKFDKRGTGLSDRSGGLPDMDQRVDDIRAVMDAAGSDNAVLLGVSEGGAMCELFTAMYPDRVSKLILLGSYSNARTAVPEFSKNAVSPDHIRQNWGTGEFLPLYSPTLAGDAHFRDWWAKFERLSASPSALIDLRAMNTEIDVTAILPSIQVPTLILHATNDVRIKVEAAREMARIIPNAELVELAGDDHLNWLTDTTNVVEEIRKFVGAEGTVAEHNRVLATVLFTDIVGSTKWASELGDSKWAAMLKTHDSLARGELDKFRGRMVKTLGDGLLATFDGPARAVRCAQALAKKVRTLGLELRSGLHIGEIEVARDGDIHGIAVHVASRISHQAASNEVLISGTLRDLVAGSGIKFEDIGAQKLKGIDEPIRVYRASH
ncbi:MAG: adenylate/guanylate cyclase domain-containing protein [Hyphomicrobiaceae bacterium]